MYISATRFEAPIIELGFTALSVEIITNSPTPEDAAASARVFVPKTLFFIASPGFHSITGTCLWAAAWKTQWGLAASKIFLTRSRSQISAMYGITRAPGEERNSSRGI